MSKEALESLDRSIDYKLSYYQTKTDYWFTATEIARNHGTYFGITFEEAGRGYAYYSGCQDAVIDLRQKVKRVLAGKVVGQDA